MICCLCISDLALAGQGTVRWFDPAKGHGFIVPDDGGEDMFVHHRELRGMTELCAGQRVSFEVTQGPKGKQASHVHTDDASCGSPPASAPAADEGSSGDASGESETWDEQDSDDGWNGEDASSEDESFDDVE
jgi:CspA family cold shock protein